MSPNSGIKESIDGLSDVLKSKDELKPHQACLKHMGDSDRRVHDRIDSKLSSWIWGATAISMLTVLISGLVMMDGKVDKMDYKDDIRIIKADIKLLLSKTK